MIDIDVILLFYGVAIVLLTQVILLCGRKKAGADADVSERQSTEPMSEATERSERGKPDRVLDKNKLNPSITNMQIAARDPVINRAMQIELEMQQGAGRPFKNIIRANIGDAEAMEHSSMTFNRQLLSCVANPELIPSYPPDVADRAKAILTCCGGFGPGAYNHAQGIEVVRRHVADFITRRDGFDSEYTNIVINNGASEAIRNVLEMFANHDRKKRTGVMIPVPTFPLFAATLDEFGLGKVEYQLDEEKGWSIDEKELDRAYDDSRKKYDTKVLVVINPGSPTGHLLSRENIQAIVKFAHRHGLFIMADEVYQASILELVSFHSVSKGYMGECGVRGGYAEFYNMDPEVFGLYKKLISAKQFPSILSQAAVDALVNPPKQSDPSFEQWAAEKKAALEGFKKRAAMVKQAFNGVEGLTCNDIQASLYAFPRVQIPPGAIDKAKKEGVEPDFLYAMELLEATGVCVVPGCAFGQKEDTYHFRMTILPHEGVLQDMLDRIKVFHIGFMKQYKQ
ncbi:aminotransferase, class I/II [Teladorsagia circumcincta]|uniref:alanine transaminase n=1 Tax=Teladorsagia circumcincta TaxID=45464 RepID=A0A2G9UC17_TELCI|nr:aminotransferase, class I/II [Teladorsagia circumcincta]